MYSLALIIFVVSEKKAFEHFPIGSNVNLCPAVVAILAKWNEMEKLYREPYIDAYCQVWFHLAKLFQRRRLKYEKVNGRTTDAK